MIIKGDGHHGVKGPLHYVFSDLVCKAQGTLIGAKLTRLKVNEESNKSKWISLMASSSKKEDSDKESNDNNDEGWANQLVRRLESSSKIKVIGKDLTISSNLQREMQLHQLPYAMNVGNPGTFECPTLKKKDKGNKKPKKENKERRAYIAWEDKNLSSTSDESKEDGVSNLCLMTTHQDDQEVSDDEFKLNCLIIMMSCN